jgi:hypothetical protein
MNRLTLASSILVFLAVLLLIGSLKSGQTAAAQPLLVRPPDTVATTTIKSGVFITSSQGTAVQVSVAPSVPQDNRTLSPNATSRYYHIPGSVLMPVDSSTTLAYDYMGCIHAKTGGGDLLNAPLDIPEGSTLIGLRLYYNDTNAGTNINAWITRYNLDGTDYDDIVSVVSSGSAGHGNVWAEVDPTMNLVDPYNWSYVINGRVNGAASSLQICGIRVMYSPPAGCCAYLPSVMHNSTP